MQCTITKHERAERNVQYASVKRRHQNGLNGMAKMNGLKENVREERMKDGNYASMMRINMSLTL